MFSSRNYQTNRQKLHVMEAGDADKPIMVMLHGFPEYWAAWAPVAELLASSYRLLLPDQRGFNLSSKPTGVEAYDTKHMVADLLGLVEQVSPDQPIILCGHDWGASVAYAFAMRHPQKVSRLIIANGVHPICFQKALFENADQIEASQYMNVLREEGSEQRLSRDNFAPLMNMFERFSAAPWLQDPVRDAYRAAWGQPDSLTSMLNWYRGSQMVVPDANSDPRPFPITDEMRSKYKISMPHLLLWGMKDVALQPATRENLDAFCSDLTVVEREDASHWILHEHPEWVAQQISLFLAD